MQAQGLIFMMIKMPPSSSRPTITVVGSINMDLVFRTPRMPVIGETITGEEFRQIPGGKGANQAVAAARQGGTVSFVGCVGDDGFGQQSRTCLSADQIDVQAVTTVAQTSTGVAGILVDASGHNCIVLAPGANACVSMPLIDAAAPVIQSGQWLICQLEIPLASVCHAIDIAHMHGVRVVFNPAPVPVAAEGFPLPLSDAMLAKVDYLIVNETEAGQLSGIEVTDLPSATRAAKALRGRGAATVLLTMGEHGVLIADTSGERSMLALKVEVVDTTAAGDTFVGALSVGLAHGLGIDAAAMEAQCAAALAVTRLGAQTSIPSRPEVEQFMRSLAMTPSR